MLPRATPSQIANAEAATARDDDDDGGDDVEGVEVDIVVRGLSSSHSIYAVKSI